MITTQHQEHLVEFAVFGEFALADFTLDVAWEEIRFSQQHSGDFTRIAVITDSQWVAWSAWLSQLFVKADVTVFEDETEARNWLAETE